jgi:hypothetical protein
MKGRIRGIAIAGVAASLAAIPALSITAGCWTRAGQEAKAVMPSPPVVQAPGDGRETVVVEAGKPPRADEGDPRFAEEPGSAGQEQGKLADGEADGARGARDGRARHRPGTAPGAGEAEPGPAESAPPVVPSAEGSAAPASPSLVDAAVRGLEWGTIAFNVPPRMRYQERQVAELVLSMTASRAELEAELATGAGAQSAEIRVSNEMEARLTGTGFAIKPIEPASQAVSRLATTRWRWEVIPEEHGTRVLHLALYAHIRIAGSDKVYVVRTFDRAIHVEITVPQQLGGLVLDNWQWLWAALLVPAAGYLWRHHRRHGGPRSESLSV